MDKQVKLTVQEAQRYEVIQRLDRAEITTAQAAELVGRSERQTRRMLAAMRERGVEALAHGNRGRAPANAIPRHIRQTVMELSSSTYHTFNDRHLRDMLERKHGIVLSAASVRRIRRQAGTKATTSRRPPKKHRRRERRPKAGMLVQIDGSPFMWMGESLPWASLLIAVDDATNQVCALFRPTEDCFGYLSLMHQIIRQHGIPEAIYADRHSIFVPHEKADHVEQQLSGQPKPTQFGRVAQELGIRIIRARSPQAKGRVERAFRTLQDRLAKELQLHQITTLDQANAFLPHFLKSYNAHFSRSPREQEPAWKQAPPKRDLDNCIAFQFDRVVKPDHTVSFAGACLDLPKKLPHAMARETIRIRVHLDGRITFWHQEKLLGKGPTLTAEPSPDLKHIGKLLREVVPAKPKSSPKHKTATPRKKREATGWKPAPDHPWRGAYRRERARLVIPSNVSRGG